MEEKDCSYHEEQRRLHRRVGIALLVFIAAILFAVLLVWLILRPSKPSFILQDLTLLAFNATTAASASGSGGGASVLTSSMQVTLAARNPNGRIGVYYGGMATAATYRGQQITLPTGLPPTYEGHGDVAVWSPFLYGTEVPVAAELVESLAQDQVAGAVLLSVRVDGHVRWKVGTWVSGRYHLHVSCPAYIPVGERASIKIGIKYQTVQRCTVDV